ncbi:MAG: hypothetical protein AVW06_03890 [Hadesarchaea archaeon DG-33-1]|nr:MAG: hypothetical protein AVW06_03890 [Hadesarchaea archaeon DG-33-1]
MLGLLVSTVCAQAQAEDVKIDMTIELRPDGKGHIEVSAEAPPAEEVMENLAQIPITGASLSIEISSPSSGRLDIWADGSVTLSETKIENLPPEAQLLLHMTSEQINLMLDKFDGKCLGDISFSGFEVPGLPPELADLKIEDISCTKFSWSESKLTAAFSLKLSGTVFENEEFRAKLPLSIDATMSTSPTRLSLTIELEASGVEGSLEMIFASDKTTIEGELTFELPKVGNEARWDFGMPVADMMPGIELEQLPEQLQGGDITLNLNVPEGATVSGLPPGYSNVGNTYTWEDENGASTFAATFGGAQGTISYDVAPDTKFPWLTVGVVIAIVIIVVAAVFILWTRR